MWRSKIPRLSLYTLIVSSLTACSYQIGDYKIGQEALNSISREVGHIAERYDRNNDNIISLEEANRAKKDLRVFLGTIDVMEKSANTLSDLAKSKPKKPE